MFLRHKNSYLVIVAIAIVFLAGVLFFDYEKNNALKVEAAATENVMGFAWSENIGWISFNSLNCDMDDNEVVDVGAPLGCPAAGTALFSLDNFLSHKSHSI
ncbi:hypothetical protein KJ854_06175 [Patescibacteria group bacterium]|nr:hypothetical protein [Patescibacteria group bacterium]